MISRTQMCRGFTRPISCILTMLVLFVCISQVRVGLASSVLTNDPVDSASLSLDLADWIDHCTNTTGWVKQEDGDVFTSPIDVISQGDLIVYPDYPYSLCFDNLPDPATENTGPLYIKDLGVSVPLHDVRLFLVKMEFQHSSYVLGGLSVFLFDNNHELAASFNLVDEWDEYGVAARISYYQSGSTVPFASHYYQTDNAYLNHEYSLLNVPGSRDIAAAIQIYSRQLDTILRNGDYNASREICYVGVQGLCVPTYMDQGEYYRLDEIKLTYEIEVEEVTDPLPTTPNDITPIPTHQDLTVESASLRAFLLVGVSFEIVIISILIVYRKSKSLKV